MDHTNLVPAIDVLALALQRRYRADHDVYDSLDKGRRAQDKADSFVAGVVCAIEALYEPKIVEIIQSNAQQRLLDAGLR